MRPFRYPGDRRHPRSGGAVRSLSARRGSAADVSSRGPDDPERAAASGTINTASTQAEGHGVPDPGPPTSARWLDLNQERDREILGLVKTADVFVENYRPCLSRRVGWLTRRCRNQSAPDLIFPFLFLWRRGPRGSQTAYDPSIQATSGIMAMTGNQDGDPIKVRLARVDYGTGMTGEFRSRLRRSTNRELHRTSGHRIDMAMLDFAMILCART